MNIIGMLAAIQVGTTLCGFHVDSVTPVPDVGGKLWRMTYEKNGAELVWLDRADEVKTFVVAFKTLPHDHTGVAHILEHSVLGGSEHFPVRDPFGEMHKNSICVFMNAMTARDKTSYPFSSRNDQDLLNLADVYLDAVFHPRSIKHPEAFRQEGWHYELDPKTGNLVYNGVVYNEMKGVMSSPESIAYSTLMRDLFPQSVYGMCSGGDPDAIPDLTYEDYCAFYHRFYHPTNAKIFLDGSVDMPSMLAKLDSYLRDFDRAAPSPAIALQRPVSSRRTVEYPSADCNRRTILAEGWSYGSCTNLVQQMALDVVCEYLAGSNEAPLNRALLSRGLCDDVDLGASTGLQLPIALFVRNTTPERANCCRAIIRETLSAQLTNGLDRARLNAIINRHEFHLREINRDSPRGLSYSAMAMHMWLYGEDPVKSFDFTGLFAQLRRGVDSGLFERCLREALVDNPHHVELTLNPSATCAAEAKARTAARLAECQRKLSPDDFARLRREIAALDDYRSHKDSPAALATLPTLRLADLPQHSRPRDYSIVTNGNLVRISTPPTCDGITYVNAYFPIDHLTADELVTVPLFADLLGELATEHYDSLALQTRTAATVGRLGFSPVATERGNFLCVRLACLTPNCRDAVRLLREIALTTRFDDLAAIERILGQARISLERKGTTRGDNIADFFAARTYSRRWAAADILRGYAQLRWLQGVKADAKLAETYAQLGRRIFVRDGLVLSVTDNLPPAVEAELLQLPSAAAPRARADLSLPSSDLAALRIDGDAGYSDTVVRLSGDGTLEGALRVAAKMITLDYLYPQIRKIGGAYGSVMRVGPGGMVFASTYRDPTPVASIEKIRRIGQVLRDFANSETPLDRFIISTVATLDPYMSPSEAALHPVSLYLGNRASDYEERIRRQVLTTTKADLLRVAEQLESRLPEAKSLIVGGDRQLQPLPAERIEPLRRGKDEPPAASAERCPNCGIRGNVL